MTVADDSAPSLWAATAAPPPEAPRLEGETRVDVAVIGGGYTGLSAALHLAEAGAKVAVLEAREPGWGASGRNGGQVIPGLKYDPDELAVRMGPVAGERLAVAAGGSADLVFDLVHRHAIECEAERSGWIHACHSPVALRRAERRAAQWQRRGVAIRGLDRKGIAELLGTSEYVGGVLDPRGGKLQPLSYARGLARAAIALGARLHARSPARSLTRTGRDWRVATDAGALLAAKVILATNAYTDDLWPGLKRSVFPLQSLQIATAPLGENVRRSILPKGHVVSDTRRLLLYFRQDGRGRLIVGGRGTAGERILGRHVAYVERAMRRLFPQVAGAPSEFVWAGHVAVTIDQLPHLHDLAPGVVAALGYNGRGVAMATLLGKLAAERALKGAAADTPFPVTALRPVPLHALRLPFMAAVMQYYRLRDTLDVRFG
ncbi:MAG: FAD-binding oxidoreductase [Rhodospirillales bacterium]|nr:FAD-binding oxidoreductase [Rhodospirillales bacterium]